MDCEKVIIIKRDGAKEKFSIEKIKRAITKAYRAGGILNEDNTIEQIAIQAASSISGTEISVEEIQDIVEKELMIRNPYIAKKYIIYREWRTVERDKKTSMKQIMDGIVAIEKNDINLSNANMSSHTPAGQMMTFASEVTKDYAYKYLLGVRYARAHKNGDIHIHDLDYYPTKTTTCIQYDLDDILERGFHTKNGTVRTPQSIQSYATLATIIFQTNQNEQHGGQAIPAFDHFMSKGVIKSFRKHLESSISFILNLKHDSHEINLKEQLHTIVTSIDLHDKQIKDLFKVIHESGASITEDELRTAWEQSYSATRKDTHQAMEAFIHNLNTCLLYTSDAADE